MSLNTKPYTVLVCDDEEGIRESFKLILSDFYNVEFAYNGMQALEILKKMKPHAMFLDIKMPKLQGLETLKKIKKANPNLPVIVVSGYQSVEIAQEAIKNGASNYIPKPFESKQILKAVEEVIRFRFRCQSSTFD